MFYKSASLNTIQKGCDVLRRSAFRDKEKTILVKANDCTINDIRKDFYCATDGCNCIVSVVALSSTKRVSYFRAKDRKQIHSKKCQILQSKFNEEKYDENCFNFEYVIKKSMNNEKGISKNSDNNNSAQKEKSSGTTAIETIGKLYYLCRSYPINHTYNNYKIGEMLIDERSSKIYTKYAKGYKLIRCFYKRYDAKNLTIYFDCDNIQIKAIFSSADLFYKLKNKIYTSPSEEKPPIVLSGEVKYKPNVKDALILTVNILSEYQFYFPQI